MKIMKKGLHVLARKRYGSVEQLYGEIKELLLRIDGKGISHSAAWENSCRRFKGYKGVGERYLERHIRMEEGKGQEKRVLTQKQCLSRLESGGLMLLAGPGGMGKTRLLMQVWGDFVKIIVLLGPKGGPVNVVEAVNVPSEFPLEEPLECHP